jgi:hypothetical protein
MNEKIEFWCIFRQKQGEEKIVYFINTLNILHLKIPKEFCNNRKISYTIMSNYFPVES